MALEGKFIGRYQLQHLLGSGGMGEVYLATDTLIARQVAIKVIRTEVSSYPNADSGKDAVRLFQREAKAIAALDHPHILPLYDYGEVNLYGAPLAYMVMPNRQEGTLANWMRDRGNATLLAPQDVVYLVAQAASALQYAHDRQIIHQDVKPSNFLLRGNEERADLPYLLLADFGVAKFTTATSNASQSIRGTPAYMAPEQWEGQPVVATDQYALAIMAYELLAGRPPFQGGLGQIMYQHINVVPQPPGTLNPGISQEIDEVILRALAKKPSDRFFSITAFAHALQQAAQSLPLPTVRKEEDEMDLPTLLNPHGQPKSEDIYATLLINAGEAQAGTKRNLTLPGGQGIAVTIPPGTSDGQVLQFDTQGNPYSSNSQSRRLLLTIVVARAAERTVLAPSSPHTATVVSAPSPPPQYDYNRGGAIGNGIVQNARTISQPRRFPTVGTLLLIGLALVVVAGSGFFFARAIGGSNTNNGFPVTARNTQSTTSSTPTATTASTQSPGTTATNVYTHTGSLALNDPLIDNSQGHAWLEGTNSLGASCSFTGGGYQATQPNAGYFHACMAQSSDFSNFVFEIQMTMVAGDYAGLVFRNNPASSQYYFYSIDAKGQYYLKLFAGSNDSILSQGPAPVINFGQSYLLAVAANYGNISLYVDQQKIANLTDGTLSHGQIGVFVGNVTNAAVAVFRNARLWVL